MCAFLISPYHHGSVKVKVKVGISVANFNDIILLLVCLQVDRVTWFCLAAGGRENNHLVLYMKNSCGYIGIVNKICVSIMKFVDWEGNSLSPYK
jgi:hypothetical protein